MSEDNPTIQEDDRGYSDLYSIEELAKMFNADSTVVRHAIHRGRIKAVKDPKKHYYWMIRLDEFQRWLGNPYEHKPGRKTNVIYF